MVFEVRELYNNQRNSNFRFVPGKNNISQSLKNAPSNFSWGPYEQIQMIAHDVGQKSVLVLLGRKTPARIVTVKNLRQLNWYLTSLPSKRSINFKHVFDKKNDH